MLFSCYLSECQPHLWLGSTGIIKLNVKVTDTVFSSTNSTHMLLCCYHETCEETLKILGIVWETAWNEIRRDSSEMNPGWSLAPANQITTKGSSAWGNLSVGSYGLEILGEEQRDGASTQQMYLIGDEGVAEFPWKTRRLIAFVIDAPAGVSKANAN